MGVAVNVGITVGVTLLLFGFFLVWYEWWNNADRRCARDRRRRIRRMVRGKGPR